MEKRLAGLAVGTRFFDNRPGSSPAKIVEFAKKYATMAEKVIVAINIDADQSGAKQALENLGLDNLVVLGVSPWVKFVPAMNTLVSKAALLGMNRLLSCSTEVSVSENSLRTLIGAMSEDTLCAGARLPEHEFLASELSRVVVVEGTGTTIPWNTCCLYNLEKLSLVGFPLVGDALLDPTGKLAGVEELTAFAVMQTLYKNLQIKLVEVPEIKWETTFSDDPARRVQQVQKIASKRERPAEQLRRLGLKAPMIAHIR